MERKGGAEGRGGARRGGAGRGAVRRTCSGGGVGESAGGSPGGVAGLV